MGFPLPPLIGPATSRSPWGTPCSNVSIGPDDIDAFRSMLDPLGVFPEVGNYNRATYPLDEFAEEDFGSPLDDGEDVVEPARLVFTRGASVLLQFLASDLLAGFDIDTQRLVPSPLAQAFERVISRYDSETNQVNSGLYARVNRAEDPGAGPCPGAARGMAAWRQQFALRVASGAPVTDAERALFAADLQVPPWAVASNRAFNPLLSGPSPSSAWYRGVRDSGLASFLMGSKVAPPWSVFPLNWYVVSYPGDLVFFVCTLIGASTQRAAADDDAVVALLSGGVPLLALPDTEVTGEELLTKQAIRDYADRVFDAAAAIGDDDVDIADIFRALIASDPGIGVYQTWLQGGIDDAPDAPSVTAARFLATGPVLGGWLAVQIVTHATSAVVLAILRRVSSINDELKALYLELARALRAAGSAQAGANDSVGWLLIAATQFAKGFDALIADHFLANFVAEAADFSAEAALLRVIPGELTVAQVLQLGLGLVTNPPQAGVVDTLVRQQPNPAVPSVYFGDEVSLPFAGGVTGDGTTLALGPTGWPTRTPVSRVDRRPLSGVTPVFYVNWPTGRFRFGDLQQDVYDRRGPYSDWTIDLAMGVAFSDTLTQARDLVAAGCVADSLFIAAAELGTGCGSIPHQVRTLALDGFGWGCLDELLQGRSLAHFIAGVWRLLMAEAFIGFTCGSIESPGRRSLEPTAEVDVQLSSAIRPNPNRPDLVGGPEYCSNCVRELFCWMLNDDARYEFADEDGQTGRRYGGRWADLDVIDRVLGAPVEDYDWTASWVEDGPGWRRWDEGLLRTGLGAPPLCDGWADLSCEDQDVLRRFVRIVTRDCYLGPRLRTLFSATEET